MDPLKDIFVGKKYLNKKDVFYKCIDTDLDLFLYHFINEKSRTMYSLVGEDSLKNKWYFMHFVSLVNSNELKYAKKNCGMFIMKGLFDNGGD